MIIETTNKSKASDTSGVSNTPEITQDKLGLVRIDDYNDNIQQEARQITTKINSLENKLVKLELKESMIDNIITRTNALLESIDPKNFKWIGQTQSNLMKQIESLGLIKDIIIKYEDMILKYRKMLIDIEEKKVMNRFKLAALYQEEEEKDIEINEILSQVQELLGSSKSQKNNDIKDNSTNSQENENPMIETIMQELKEEGY